MDTGLLVVSTALWDSRSYWQNARANFIKADTLCGPRDMRQVTL